MLEPFEKTTLFQLFAGRFGQDYDLLVEISDDKPLLQQLVADYKQQCSASQLEKTIDELTALVSLEYPEEKLRDEIFEKLLIELSLSHLGLTHQEFLMEVLKLLINPKPEHSEPLQNLETLSSTDKASSKQEEKKLTQDDLAYFKSYPSPPKQDNVISTGIEGLLTVYFAKSYDELVEQYGKMRFISQIVAKYKEEQSAGYVTDCVNEVERLVNKQHDENYLRELIVNQYGVKIPISKLGGSYQVFLERVHEELAGKRLYT